MKKLKLIYNPNSGDKTFRFELDTCVQIFQGAGYEVQLFRSMTKGDIEEHIETMARDFDAAVVSGGDGTINIVLNALLKNNLNIPLGVIPSGTANDFAAFLKIPRDVEEACKIIAAGQMIQADVGMANDRYFINVCGAGLLTNISQHIDPELKNLLGKFAYYLKGLEQLPNFEPFRVRIKNTRETIIDEIYFFIALNSAGTGGFEKLSSYAEINDGKFDFIAFRKMPVIELARVFVNVLKGDYLNDANIIYFQDNYMEIEALSGSRIFSETDIDGEQGPDLPVIIKNIHNAVRFFCPEEISGGEITIKEMSDAEEENTNEIFKSEQA